MAVVGDGDDNLGSELHGVEHDARLWRLAGAQPLLGGLDAVVDGVAHEVQQRVRELAQHAPVEFGVAAPHLPRDILAQRPGQVPHRPVELVGHGGDRHHAGPHGALLKVVEGTGELGELWDPGGRNSQPLPEQAAHAQVGGGGFADQADELVEALERDHDHAGVVHGGRGTDRRRGEGARGDDERPERDLARGVSWLGARALGCRRGRGAPQGAG